MCCDLIDWVCQRRIPGDFTMDSYFTNAEILNHIHGKTDHFGQPRAYVGDRKSNRKVQWQGRILKVDHLAASIPAAMAITLSIGFSDRSRSLLSAMLLKQ